ncbi:MAG TPA: hypothetical protein VMR50_10590 [Myxococcota bacterium]|nr:hypothetical protein [Myxococcota bacterium]
MKALRRVAVTLALLLSLAGAAIGVALWRTDANAIRQAVGARLEATVGQPVTLGPADRSLFPLPAVRIRDVQLGVGPKLSVSTPKLRIELSPLPLLLGEIVLRSFEVERPRLEAVPVAASSGFPPGAAERVRFAVTRVRGRDGTVALGGVNLEHVEAHAAFTETGTPVLEWAGEIAGIGEVEQGFLEATERSGPFSGWGWRASAELNELDLAVLARRLALPEVFGTARGKLSASGHGLRPEQAKLALESADFAARGGFGSATGHAALELDESQRVTLDLGGAALRLFDAIEKPAGTPLLVMGQWGEVDGVRGLRDAKVETGPVRGSGVLELGGASAVVRIHDAALDLAALSGWRPASWVPRAGRVELSRGRVATGPLVLDLAGSFASMAVPWHGVTLLLSGPFNANGTVLACAALGVELAGESVTASGTYDWSSRQLHGELRANGGRVGPIAEAAWGRKDVSGRLYGQIELAGAPGLTSLTGRGELELLDGEIGNVSLARPAGLIKTAEEPPGLDLFDRLSAHFELAGDTIHVSELTLFQKYSVATVTGEIELPDWYANMTGAVMFSPSDLWGRSLRPILRMAGPIWALETHVSTARSADEQRVEAATIEAIRKAEREQRERKKAAAKSNG